MLRVPRATIVRWLLPRLSRLALVFAHGAGMATLAIPREAHAAPTSAAQGDREETAEELFQRAHVAYRDGRFQDAVELLLHARRRKNEAVLLYDLGRAYEALGQPADAADAYARYLEEAPATSDRKAIEGRIATLRRQVEEQEALRRAAERPPATPAARDAEGPPLPSGPPRTSAPLAAVPWIVGGVGLVAVGTGAVFGLLSRSRSDDAAAERVQAVAADTYDGAKRDAVIANVTLISGAVLLVTAGAWLLVRAASADPSKASATRGHAVDGFAAKLAPALRW